MKVVSGFCLFLTVFRDRIVDAEGHHSPERRIK